MKGEVLVNKIVVVEDDVLLQEELVYLLSKENYETIAITDFSGNISAQIRTFKPDLVLLDLNLPTQSGFEICRSLKLNWLGAKIIYVRVHNMSSRGNQQVLYGEMAVKICKKYSIPVVDMYNEGGLNTQMDEMTNLYTNNADSTHPNGLGYRTFYVPKVRAEMLIS